MALVCAVSTAGAVFANRSDSGPKQDSNTASAVAITERVVTYRTPIPFQVERQVSPELRTGMSVVLRTGKEGAAQRTYRITYRGGKEIRRELIEEKLLEPPQNRIVQVGPSRLPSRGSLGWRSGELVRRVLRMHATAYDPGPRSCGRWGGRTAMGLRAGRGIVAVDPRVIRLGTKLYIEGYGHAIAGDTGGAIKGHRIDLGFDTYREAIRFGRRHVTVHVLK